jgi:nucleoside-diphosphate-sugar epimerase
MPESLPMQRVLITGCQGFIGQACSRALREAGYDVWGLDLMPPKGPQTFRADLQKLEETRKAIAAAPSFSVLIHTAALAHGQRPPRGESCFSANTSMTENLLRALGQHDPRLIFLSSVAVYGEDRRANPVTVRDPARPATEYGRSKLRCEEHIRVSHLTHCDVLRLAPVYDSDHLKDVRKRVYLPGLPVVKICWKPVPQYSLCHVNTVCEAVLSLLRQKPRGRRVFNVADPVPYKQTELVSWFPGRAISLWSGLLRPLYWSSFLLPATGGYAIRCLYCKLFQSNIYLTDRTLDFS